MRQQRWVFLAVPALLFALPAEAKPLKELKKACKADKAMCSEVDWYTEVNDRCKDNDQVACLNLATYQDAWTQCREGSELACAERGFVQGQSKVGKIHDQRAAQILSAACDQGVLFGCHWHAFLVEEGKVEGDSVTWFTRGCDGWDGVDYNVLQSFPADSQNHEAVIHSCRQAAWRQHQAGNAEQSKLLFAKACRAVTGPDMLELIANGTYGMICLNAAYGLAVDKPDLGLALAQRICGQWTKFSINSVPKTPPFEPSQIKAAWNAVCAGLVEGPAVGIEACDTYLERLECVREKTGGEESPHKLPTNLKTEAAKDSEAVKEGCIQSLEETKDLFKEQGC